MVIINNKRITLQTHKTYRELIKEQEGNERFSGEKLNELNRTHYDHKTRHKKRWNRYSYCPNRHQRRGIHKPGKKVIDDQNYGTRGPAPEILKPIVDVPVPPQRIKDFNSDNPDSSFRFSPNPGRELQLANWTNHLQTHAISGTKRDHLFRSDRTWCANNRETKLNSAPSLETRIRANTTPLSTPFSQGGPFTTVANTSPDPKSERIKTKLRDNSLLYSKAQFHFLSISTKAKKYHPKEYSIPRKKKTRKRLDHRELLSKFSGPKKRRTKLKPLP